MPPKSPLLDQVRRVIRLRHMSIRTEEAYVRWITEFLRFEKERTGDWRHPKELGNREVNDFLTSLAVERKVAISTQNQAFSAIVFLYREVLKKEVTLDAVRAKRPERLPVVLSIDEVRRLLNCIPEGPFRLMAGLMHGAGMRLMEVCRLRVKDLILKLIRSSRTTQRKTDSLPVGFQARRPRRSVPPCIRWRCASLMCDILVCDPSLTSFPSVKRMSV